MKKCSIFDIILFLFSYFQKMVLFLLFLFHIHIDKGIWEPDTTFLPDLINNNAFSHGFTQRGCIQLFRRWSGPILFSWICSLLFIFFEETSLLISKSFQGEIAEIKRHHHIFLELKKALNIRVQNLFLLSIRSHREKFLGHERPLLHITKLGIPPDPCPVLF